MDDEFASGVASDARNGAVVPHDATAWPGIFRRLLLRPSESWPTAALPLYQRPESARSTPIRQGTWLAMLGFGALLFGLDSYTVADGLASTLYIAILTPLAERWSGRVLLLLCATCLVLTAATYPLAHGFVVLYDPLFRRLVSGFAIVIATQLMLASQKIRQHLTEQSLLLELTGQMVLVLDDNNAIISLNPPAEKLYGWTTAEVQGQKLFALLQTEASQSWNEIEKNLREWGFWEGELAHTSRNGERHIMVSRLRRHVCPTSGKISIIDVSTDISQIKKISEAVRRSEERYRMIFNAVGVSIWEEDYTEVVAKITELQTQGIVNFEAYFESNPDFVAECVRLVRIVDVNDSGVRLFEARDKSELLESLEKIYPPGSTGSLTKILIAIAEGATFCAGTTVVRTMRGNELSILMSAHLPSSRSQMSSVLINVVDDTARRQIREALAQAQERLLRINQITALGEMTATIAHEVNHPLAAIITNAEAARRWLTRTVPNQQEARDALEAVIHNASTATVVAERVRNLARENRLQQSMFSMREAIQEACLLLEQDLCQQQISLSLDCGPQLASVMGDRIQIERVLVNLISNAIHAMADQSLPRTLAIQCRSREKNLICVRIEDNGIGFPVAASEKLFTPFFTTKPDGMGLGLTICRAIIASHRGEIWVSNSNPRGATVQFTLPAAST